MNTLAEFSQELRRLSSKVDSGVVALATAAEEYARADSEYRHAKARAFMASEGKTVPAKEADVDLACAEERLRQRIAEGHRLACVEALRSRRQQLSAWQSLLTAWKADVELHRFGPDVA